MEVREGSQLTSVLPMTEITYGRGGNTHTLPTPTMDVPQWACQVALITFWYGFCLSGSMACKLRPPNVRLPWWLLL